MEAFSIACPTCKARLKVRDAAAIGQILNCPKCGSMMQVAAPAGWQPGDQPAAQQPPSATPPDGLPAGGRRRWENELRPGEKAAHSSSLTPATASSGGLRLGESSGGVFSADASPSSVSHSDALVGAAAGQSSSDMAPDQPGSAAAGLAGFGAPWIRWGALVGGPAMAVVLAAGFWLSRPSLDVADAPPAAESLPVSLPLDPTAEQEDNVQPAPAEASPPDEPVRLARRWLPSDAQAIVSLRPKLLLTQPAARVVLDRTSALWQGAIDKLASPLGLDPRTLQRATWSSNDIASGGEDDWLTRAVVVIELAQPLDAASRGIRDSEPLDWKIDETPVRQLKSHAWPHPFAIIDKRLVVTGPEAALRDLAARTEHRLANEALDQLVDTLDAQAAAVAVLDLRALREAEALPHWLPLVDVLHADAEDWKLLRALPLALGLTIGVEEQIELQVDLACDGASSAGQAHASLDRVLAAIEATIGGETNGLTGKLLAGQINAALAAQLQHFLAASQSALADRESGVRDAIAWTRLNWQGDLPKLSSAFLASIPRLEDSRLAAARRLDEEHHRLLMQGLQGYVKAEDGLPAGAAGATLLPPETRLSWQATLLPYFGHLDWQSELNFARAWNDPLNQRVTRRPLELMVNPALGPGATKAGFPLTHYVGVAGLGADAGQLDADDPRAGVFGFRPRRSPAQIADGASNTIALAGVSGKLGPWAEGGGATVRGLTQRPYIHGPDGFGSGQPQGMLVSMADGSVRFLPKDIDPEVLERLVTIAGGEAPPEALAAAGRPAADDMPEPAREKPAAKTPARKAPGRKEPAAIRKPLLKRPRLDIAARLHDRIPAIELKSGTTLAELVDLLSQLSAIPITLDADALSDAGVQPDATVSLSLSNATVGEILAAALGQHELKYIVEGDQIIVTDARQAAEVMESTTFDVSDLARSAKSDEGQLAQWIETFVAPAAWQASGGAGSLKATAGALTVEQTPAVTGQVADFLDKLRMARELPITRREGRRLSLATRWARARDKLAARVTVNFPAPTPLKEIAAHLRKAAGIEIVFDGLALAAAGASPDERGLLSANEQPLGEAIDKLLQPLKLGCRIVNGQTLEITSQRELAEDLEVEFYALKPPSGGEADANDPDRLMARIRKEAAPSSWREHGGAAALAIDASSNYLIALAPQHVQIELERWLEKRAEPGR